MSKWTFKRHLDDDAFDALLTERDANGWLAEVLGDKDCIVTLRNNAVDVYHHGQSILHLGFKGSAMTVDTHPKYLVDPALKNRVAFSGGAFALDQMKEPLLKAWGPGALDRIKKSARLYAGAEKSGCHAAIKGRNDILDVEVALRRDSELRVEGEDLRDIPRIDIVQVVRHGDTAALEFWEAKNFGNKELGSMGYRVKDGNEDSFAIERAVLGQIKDYQQVIKDQAAHLLASYAKACQQLHELYAPTDRYGAGTVIGEIATGQRSLMVGPDGGAAVNLLLFGFDQAQKDASRGALNHLGKSLAALGGKLKAIGDPKGAF